MEWCTVKQNAHHAIENNLYDPGASSRRPVRKIDKNSGECLQVYNSITDAEKAMGILKHTGTIGDCIRGRIKSAYGYKWTYNNI